MIPKFVEFRDSLPKGSTGKIARWELGEIRLPGRFFEITWVTRTLPGLGSEPGLRIFLRRDREKPSKNGSVYQGILPEMRGLRCRTTPKKEFAVSTLLVGAVTG